jgi:hypothetical protein
MLSSNMFSLHYSYYVEFLLQATFGFGGTDFHFIFICDYVYLARHGN